MPYKVRKNQSQNNGRKKWLILGEKGKILGSSDTKAKATRSIGYREEAEQVKK
jgi:hypothetical protein